MSQSSSLAPREAVRCQTETLRMCFTLLSVLRKHARRELVDGRALADQEAGLDVCAQRLEDEWRLGLETSSLNSRADGADGDALLGARIRVVADGVVHDLAVGDHSALCVDGWMWLRTPGTKEGGESRGWQARLKVAKCARRELRGLRYADSAARSQARGKWWCEAMCACASLIRAVSRSGSGRLGERRIRVGGGHRAPSAFGVASVMARAAENFEGGKSFGRYASLRDVDLGKFIRTRVLG